MAESTTTETGTPGPGHNSGDASAKKTADGSISAQRLRQFISRIERLEDERANLGTDIREVYSGAKSAGFDAKIMRQVIKLRKMDKADRDEQEAMLDLYLDAIGME